MYFIKINCDLPISSPLSFPISSHKAQPYTIATFHSKKFILNFVVHVTKVFSNESSCEIEIEKKHFLVLNSNDNGIVEMSDVHAFDFASPAICGGTNIRYS